MNLAQASFANDETCGTRTLTYFPVFKSSSATDGSLGIVLADDLDVRNLLKETLIL